jgi:hypothetical protein
MESVPVHINQKQICQNLVFLYENREKDVNKICVREFILISASKFRKVDMKDCDNIYDSFYSFLRVLQ